MMDDMLDNHRKLTTRLLEDFSCVVASFCPDTQSMSPLDPSFLISAAKNHILMT